jgi:hypothetical protein
LVNGRGPSRDYDSGACFQALTSVNFPENGTGQMNQKLLRIRARRDP